MTRLLHVNQEQKRVLSKFFVSKSEISARIVETVSSTGAIFSWSDQNVELFFRCHLHPITGIPMQKSSEAYHELFSSLDIRRREDLRTQNTQSFDKNLQDVNDDDEQPIHCANHSVTASTSKANLFNL